MAEEWLTKYPLRQSISQSSLENYTSFVRHHLIPFFGEMPVSTVTTETVENFIAAKRSGGSAHFKGRALGESSLRTGLIALRLILERAVKTGFLPGNPARGVGRFPLREEDSVDPFMPGDRSPEQLRHTFAWMMLSRNAPVLYVQRQGGWRSASVLLRVYARWMPQEFEGNQEAITAATPAQPATLTVIAGSAVTT